MFLESEMEVKKKKINVLLELNVFLPEEKKFLLDARTEPFGKEREGFKLKDLSNITSNMLTPVSISNPQNQRDQDKSPSLFIPKFQKLSSFKYFNLLNQKGDFRTIFGSNCVYRK